MTFRLEIQLGNAAMLTGRDVATALRDAAHAIDFASDTNANREPKHWDAFDRSKDVRDENGNIVGRWSFGR